MPESLTCSVKDAAKALGAGVGSTYELIRSKKLRSVRVGKRILVPKSALLEFINTVTNEQNS